MAISMKILARAICAAVMAAGLILAESRASVATVEVGDRDKTGTTGVQETEDGSQVTIIKALTSRVSFRAEGKGLSKGISRSPCDHATCVKIR